MTAEEFLRDMKANAGDDFPLSIAVLEKVWAMKMKTADKMAFLDVFMEAVIPLEGEIKKLNKRLQRLEGHNGN